MNPDFSRIFDLRLPDQLQLVEDLWDHIAASKEPLPVPDWRKDELDRRKRNFAANPDSAVPWEDAKIQIRRRGGFCRARSSSTSKKSPADSGP